MSLEIIVLAGLLWIAAALYMASVVWREVLPHYQRSVRLEVEIRAAELGGAALLAAERSRGIYYPRPKERAQ